MNKKLQLAIATGGTLALVLSSMAFPAFAIGLNTNVSGSVSSNNGGLNIGVGASVTAEGKIIANAQDRADREIARRIDALNALIVRVNAMQKISADQKAALAASIQNQISTLNDLKAQIAADVQAQSTSSLKTDLQSILKAYRIFMLVIPQGAIEAAADRIVNVAGSMTTLSAQLQTRITAANASGTDISASQSLLADMNAKITDANTKTTAAVTEVGSLTPDNGDQAKMQANLTALKDARSKIQAAQQDLVAARQDAIKIIKNLKIAANATAGVSASSSAH